MATHVALLRGINVGRAKRVGMEDLRGVFAGLGYADVRTLLNSGNVVFTASRRPAPNATAKLEAGLLSRTGVSARITLLSSDELTDAFDDCPLLSIATDPTRLQVAVPSAAPAMKRLRPFDGKDWTPEALALGKRVAYLWCPDGVIASRLSKAVGDELGDAVTTRNWATVTKLVAAVGSVSPG